MFVRGFDIEGGSSMVVSFLHLTESVYLYLKKRIVLHCLPDQGIRNICSDSPLLATSSLACLYMNR